MSAVMTPPPTLYHIKVMCFYLYHFCDFSVVCSAKQLFDLSSSPRLTLCDGQFQTVIFLQCLNGVFTQNKQIDKIISCVTTNETAQSATGGNR